MARSLQVFGISGDSAAENKLFKQAHNLNYDLLSDENDILRKEFGIKKELFVLPGRQTYVISKDGKCIMSFNDMMNTSKHITEALTALGI
jgi:thioredoxin-dependent peroxiredoxin